MTRSIALRLATLTVLALGCSGAGASDPADGGAAGAGGTGGGGQPGDPDVEAFCRSVRAATVERNVRCVGVASGLAEQLVPSDLCATWGAAVAAGRMAFDKSQVAACLSALSTLSCDGRRLPAYCRRALDGLQAPGAQCSRATERSLFSECEIGTLCLFPAGACQGTCVKGALLGQSCGPAQPCTVGETCNLGTQKCDPTGSEGSACGITSILLCDEGLYCNDPFGGGGVCSKRHPTGECASPDECAAPAQCDKLGLTGTCRVPPKEGDPCTPFEFACTIGLMYCGEDNKCHARPSLGQPCNDTDGEGATCLLGQCDNALSTCKPFAAGEPCAIDAECGPGMLCVPQNGIQRCTASCF